jgi:hypothetical protein
MDIRKFWQIFVTKEFYDDYQSPVEAGACELICRSGVVIKI